MSAALLSAQPQPVRRIVKPDSLANASASLEPGEVLETSTCQNGAAATVAISDFVTSLSASATMGRVSDCDSTNTVTTIAIDSCRVRQRVPSATAVSLTGENSTPSSTTPVVSYYDAGPAVTVRLPDRELRLPRRISGATTVYSFLETRTPSIGDILNPGSSTGSVRDGHYSVSWGDGRDVPAFEFGFYLETLKMTSPNLGATLPSGAPPTLTWTGGGAIVDPLTISAVILATGGKSTWEMECRIADGKSGQFTFPVEAWERVPADVRAGGIATLGLTGQAKMSPDSGVPNLPDGLFVTFLQSASRSVVLKP